jgi:DNA-binding transcriptional LysR family regulator
MEIRQLKTFIVVADKLSFTKASASLNMAQSSVSAQIKLLEEELDLKLFDRIGRSVLLTEAGEKLYKYARKMVDMTHEIRSEFSRDHQSVTGALTVRVPETIASVYMPEIIKQFCSKYPNVKIELINCSDEQLKEELNSGRIDLAFLLTDNIYFKEVNIKRLKSEKLIIVSSPGNPAIKRTPVRLRDFEGQTLLLPKTD